MACGLGGLLISARIDQYYFQRGVLKHAVKGLGVDKTHRQQKGVYRDGHAQARFAGC
jgi:hypothetical protein